MKALIFLFFIASVRFAVAGDNDSMQESRLRSILRLGDSSVPRPAPMESARRYSSQFFPKPGKAIPIARILAETAAFQKNQGKQRADLATWCTKAGPVISVTKIDGSIGQISNNQFFAHFRTTATFRADKCLLVVEVLGNHKSWKLVSFHTNHFDYE